MHDLKKVWRHIKSPRLRQSMRIYLENNCAKFHPDQIWNDGDLSFLKSVTPTRKTRTTSRRVATLDQFLIQNAINLRFHSHDNPNTWANHGAKMHWVSQTQWRFLGWSGGAKPCNCIPFLHPNFGFALSIWRATKIVYCDHGYDHSSLVAELVVIGGAGHFGHKTLRHHKIGAEV